jgi:hypothetical protein
MRAIIDKSVPFAKTYYSTYLAEPSPAGDITLSPDSMTAVDHMSLEKLLTEMKDVGPGGEILVVTHSAPDGFLMALTPGAKSSLLFSVMDKILAIAEGIRRREAIRSLPAPQAADAWRKWYEDLEPGVKPDFTQDGAWQPFVEKKYDEWFERQGSVILKLPHGGKSLTNLLDLLDDVRKLGFKRIEFRACQIGADPDAMKTIARFLQVQTVVGPKNVQTFYGSYALSQITFIPSLPRLAAALKQTGGRKLADSLGILMLPRAFRILAQDQAALKAFVKKYISSKYIGGIAPLVVGGVNSVGAKTTMWIFPLEADYKTLIDRFDASAAAGAAAP